MNITEIIGAGTLRKFLSFATLVFGIGLFVLSAGSTAAEAQEAVEGAGKLGSFAIDVLQDFALEGKTAEESGEARLKSFLKGKLLDELKGKITGGDDLSLGMDLILKRIFDALNVEQRRPACDLAAMTQAYSIAFDAKNLRLLRGSANIVFDLLTSAIPGAAGLAEKLVTAFGTAAYEAIRSEIEKKIKEAWANQQNEAFKYAKQSGPCKITMSVLWNKKKGKYLFLITGTCDCKLVPISPPYRGGSITMKSFEVLGGGSIKPVLSTADPKNPKIKLVVGPATYQVKSDCNCVIPDTGVQPPKEEDSRRRSESGRMSETAKAECPACQEALDLVNGLVREFNALAAQMDAIAKKINAEQYKTAEKDANIKKWDELNVKLDEIAKAHDKAFNAFVACEKEECKETGRIYFYDISTQRPLDVICDPCKPLVEAANALIEKYNKIVEEMNALASASRAAELRRGTVEGNKLFNKWQGLNATLKPLGATVEAKKAEVSACNAKNCPGDRWTPWKHARPITGTCTPCKDFEDRYNQTVKEYNVVIDKLNAFQKEEKAYVLEHGDAWGAGLDGLGKLQRKHGFHQLLKDERELRAKMDRLKGELDACVEEKCSAAMAPENFSVGFDCAGDECPDANQFSCEASECLEGLELACAGDVCPDSFEYTCDGGACADSFEYTCESAECPETIDYSCAGGECPDDFEYTCEAFECTDDFEYSCADGACPDSLDLACGAGACPDSMAFSCAGGECPDDFEYTCMAGECSDDFDYTCDGGECPESLALVCPGGECPGSMEFSCAGGECPDDFQYACTAGECPDSFDYACEGGECPGTLAFACEGGECPDSFDYACEGGICPDAFEYTCEGGECADSVGITCDGSECTEPSSGLFEGMPQSERELVELMTRSERDLYFARRGGAPYYADIDERGVALAAILFPEREVEVELVQVFPAIIGDDFFSQNYDPVELARAEAEEVTTPTVPTTPTEPTPTEPTTPTTPTEPTPPPPPPPSEFLTPGNYSGDFGCGISFTTLSQSGNTVTLNPLGANGATNFNIVSSFQADSASNNLTIFGSPGHSCSMFVSGASEFLLECQMGAAFCNEFLTQ